MRVSFGIFLPFPSQGHEIRATLTIIANYEQTLEDLNSTSSRHFVAKFVKEVNLNAIFKVRDILVDSIRYVIF